MGKTALALNICEHAAVEQGIGVLLISLEMSELEIAERFLCARARIDGDKLRTGRGIGHKELTILGNCFEQLRVAPIFVDDSPTRSMIQIAANARRHKRRNNI